jgi:hypothetical protein
VFEVAVVVLVRLRVDDYRVVHACAVHAPEQMLRRRRLSRAVRRARVIGKARIIRAREAVQVRVNDRRRGLGLRGPVKFGPRRGDGGERCGVKKAAA